MGLFGPSRFGQARYSGELHNLQLTQSVLGTTAPIVFGTCRVAGKLLFYGGFYDVPAPGQGKGLGGGKGNTQFEYYADCLIALASGSAGGGCAGILNIWDQVGKLQNLSGTFSYTVPTGGGSVTPITGGAAPIQHDLGVSMGVPYSVVANDYASGGVRTLTGTQQVPMEKVSGSPGAGQYAFDSATSTYSFGAAAAGAQLTISYSSVYSLYYFEATQPAEVPLTGPYEVTTQNAAYFYSDSGVTRVDTGGTVEEGASSNGYTQSGGTYTFTSDLAGVQVYISYVYTSSDSSLTNSSALNLTFFGGTLGQSPWSFMQSKYPGSAFGYTGLCYVGANPMALGESAVLPSYNYEVLGLNRFPGGSLDAHPCDAFRTLLYDAFLGVGFPAENVDVWTDAYAYWAANGYLISKSLDTQTSVADAMKEIIDAGNVAAVWSAGLLKLIPYGDATCVGRGYTYTPPTTPAAELSWDDLLASSEKKAGSSSQDDVLQISQRPLQDCWNYVQAQWSNRINDYNNELISEQNDAFIAKYGRRIESPQTWDWITSAAAASWALRLRLNRQCYLRNTYKFWLKFKYSFLEPMDMVLLPTGEPVRITQIEDGPDGRLAIEAEQWTYGSADVTIYPKQAPSSYQPDLSSALPGDAVPIFVQSTSAAANGQLNTVQIAAAGKSPNWGGCFVDVSLDGLSYTTIGTIKNRNAVGVLSAALASTADPDTADTLSVDLTLSGAAGTLSSVTQAQADVFATLAAIVDQSGLTNELVSYETATLTAAGRYDLTYLRRGVYGSKVGAHSAGAWFCFLGAGYQFLEYQYRPQFVGQTLYVKLRSFNLAGAQVQQASQVQAWDLFVGTQGSDIPTATGRPSSNTTSSTGSGAVTDPTHAYDGDFTTFADLSAPLGATSSATLILSWASAVLPSNQTLYVNYRNAVWGGDFSVFPGAAIKISTDGGTSWMTAASVAPPGPNSGSGTATLNLPSGFDLANLQVQAVAANGGSAASADIQIVEAWVQ